MYLATLHELHCRIAIAISPILQTILKLMGIMSPILSCNQSKWELNLNSPVVFLHCMWDICLAMPPIKLILDPATIWMIAKIIHDCHL